MSYVMMTTCSSSRVGRSCDPSRPSVIVWGGGLRGRDLSGRQCPTSIHHGGGGGGLGASDGVGQPLEERIEPEKGQHVFKSAVGAADSGLIDYRIEWVGGKTSAEPSVAANDEKEEGECEHEVKNFLARHSAGGW